MSFKYLGELRLPTPSEQELVRRANDEMLIRNHPQQQGILYLLCAAGFACIGAVVRNSYLLWGAAFLFPVFFVLLLIQYRIDCDVAQKVLNGNYMVASASRLKVTYSGWSACDVQLTFDGVSHPMITMELDMTEDEILENGCQQFLLVASEYGSVILQSSDVDVFVYQTLEVSTEGS